jgi:hypothetical protein
LSSQGTSGLCQGLPGLPGRDGNVKFNFAESAFTMHDSGQFVYYQAKQEWAVNVVVNRRAHRKLYHYCKESL